MNKSESFKLVYILCIHTKGKRQEARGKRREAMRVIEILKL